MADHVKLGIATRVRWLTAGIVGIGAVAACSGGQSDPGFGSTGDSGGGGGSSGGSSSGGSGVTGNSSGAGTSGSSTGAGTSGGSGSGGGASGGSSSSSSGSGSSSGGGSSSSSSSSGSSSGGSTSSSSSSSSGGPADSGGAAGAEAGGPIGCGDAGLYNPGPTNAADTTSFQQHNLDDINMYRAMMSLKPLVLDSTLSAFALTGSEELACNHMPHGHFIGEGNAIFSMGFRTMAGENQGDPNGWRVLSSNATTNETMQIDQIMQAMFDEGPAGDAGEHGHYQNIMSTQFVSVGVGLLEINGMLYLTNDFSN